MMDRPIYKGRIARGIWVMGGCLEEGSICVRTCSGISSIRVEPGTFTWSIGCQDRVQMPVFVGDIIKDPKRRCFVVIDIPGGYALCQAEKFYSLNSSYYPISEIQNLLILVNSKIIGNVVDNPECLHNSNHSERGDGCIYGK